MVATLDRNQGKEEMRIKASECSGLVIDIQERLFPAMHGRDELLHRVLLLLALLFSYPQIALVLAFCGFAASSLVRWIYFRVPVSRFLARWSPKAIRNEDSLIPSAQHSSLAAGDKAPDETHNDSTGRLKPE